MSDKRKIIVIEDDVILSDVLAIKLKKLGYDVDKAQDDVAAFQKIKTDHPACIVLDILMARKVGIGLLSQIKADLSLRDIPVLLTATAEDKDEVKHARELGARDFIFKAVMDPNEIVEKVGQMLSGVAPAPLQSTASQAPASAPQATAPVAGGKTFVLVIEDDKFLRELLVRKLSSEGFDVQNAIDATSAFAILAQRKPTIILCDLILPEVSGFEILQRIKADPKISDVPVIILSNLGQKEDTDRAMALGAKDFMVKANFTLDEIVEKIRTTLV